jgi:sugar lactone lactonase YvrE
MRTFVCAFCLVVLSSAASHQVAADELKFQNVDIIVGDVLVEEGGGWSPDASPLSRPFGIDFNANGQMFVVELEGGRVHRRDKTGELLWVSGDGTRTYKGDGEPFGKATFNGMHNCAVTPNGDLYIADSWNHCIRKVDAKSGVISTVAGTGTAGFSGDGGPAAKAAFDFIMCISLNHSGDVLHIADLKNHRIRAFDLKSGLVSTIAGNGKTGVPQDAAQAVDSPLLDPRAVAADSQGNVYILERNGHALRVVRPDGTIHTVAGTGEKGFNDGAALEAQFGSPKHICIDDKDNVYIADDENKAIRRYSPSEKKVITVLGRGYGEEQLVLAHPHGVCWEGGELYIVDTSHNRILKMPGARESDGIEDGSQQ